MSGNNSSGRLDQHLFIYSPGKILSWVKKMSNYQRIKNAYQPHVLPNTWFWNNPSGVGGRIRDRVTKENFEVAGGPTNICFLAFAKKGMGLTNQLFALSNGIKEAIKNGCKVVVIDQFLADYSTDEYMNIQDILDLPRMNKYFKKK